MLVYKVQEEEKSDSSCTNVEVPGEKKNVHISLFMSNMYLFLDTNKDGSQKKKQQAFLVWFIIMVHVTWSDGLFYLSIAAFLQRLVDQDNHKFEEWCTEMAEMRKQSVDKGKAKHEEVKELYELLPAKDGR